jgi:hypothetical protein
MAQDLKSFLKQKGLTIPNVPQVKTTTPSTTPIATPDESVSISDVAKEVPESSKKVLRWVGKQLMKPIGTVATSLLQGRIAAEEKSIEPLKKIPEKIGAVLTGKEEVDMTDFYKRALPDHPVASTLMGTVANIVLDPLNLVGGITSKALTKAEGVAQKIPIFKGLKTSFVTKTNDVLFNSYIDEMKSLGEYRKAQVLEDARDIQNTISKLPKDDVIKVSNYIEKGIKSSPKVNELGEKLKTTYKSWKGLEKEMGIKGGELAQYVPHIKVKEPLAQSIKKNVFPAAKVWSTKLGGAEKSRQILKFISDDGTELIGKAENLGLKETSMGFVDKIGKLFKPTQASIDEVANAFGKHFFEENPAIQMAYRGMAHAKAITSKEFFNGVRQFATKVGAETAVPELKGLRFSDDIARQIDSYYQSVKPEELNVLFKTYDNVLNWWKGQALLAPSYHIRNVVGNVWNNFLAGIKDPTSYIKAGQIQMNKGKNLEVAGMTGEKLLNLAKKRGVINEGWYAADIPTAVESGVKSTWKEGINPLSQQNYAFKLNKAMGSVLENNARLAHFIEKLETGSSIDDAVLSVKKYLFDYQDLTNFEKTVMKRVFPFYTWTRKNIPLQLEHLIREPGKFAGLEKVVRAVEKLSMGDTKPANEKYLSDYIKNNTAMRVGYNPETKTYNYFLLGNWLPAYQALDFLAQPLENIMAMATPLIKTPIELLANKSSFFKDTLNEYQAIENYPGETVNFLGFSIPKKTATILRNIRVLNELDKLNPGKIFGGKVGEPSVFKGLPTVTTPLGTISPATYKYGQKSIQPTAKERFLGTLFGKYQQYKEEEARRYYQEDTDKRVEEMKRAIKNASIKGDKERVKVLNEQLQQFLKERGR